MTELLTGLLVAVPLVVIAWVWQKLESMGREGAWIMMAMVLSGISVTVWLVISKL